MTRKDFELIAAAIVHARTGSASRYSLDQIALDFADRLKATNKQFNRDKFLRACGVQS